MATQSDEHARSALKVLTAVVRRVERRLPVSVEAVHGPVQSARQWLEDRDRAQRSEQLAARRAHSDGQALMADLRALGTPPDRIVFVHSSLKSLGFVQGGTEAVLDALIQVFVTELGGTLALPTFSLPQSMQAVLRSGQVFDARESPSNVGSLTEAFRKRPGVLRSLHPTHSVAALGPDADWLVRDHHTCGTTFGVGSPLGRLLEKRGLLVGLGTSLGPVTFYHVLEDLRSDFPVPVYTADSPINVTVRDAAGVEHRMAVSAHDSEVARVRIDKDTGLGVRAHMTDYLRRTDRLRTGVVGTGEVWWLPAEEMMAALEELLAQGVTIYSDMRQTEGAPTPTPQGTGAIARRTARSVYNLGRAMTLEFALPPRARLRRRRDAALREDPGVESTIRAAFLWLASAQDRSATRDGGFARDWGYRTGWAASYPETTGYIVPTLLDSDAQRYLPDARDRALRALNWLRAIQQPSGGFQGGVIGVAAKQPVTFNTGQILNGLSYGMREFGPSWEGPTRAAADWLVSIQDADGAWRKHLTTFAAPGPKAYETHTAWGLIEAHRATGDERYAAAALRNVAWALSHQRGNGWFERCCLSDQSRPLTHTIGYAVRGIVEAWRLTGDDRLLQAALRSARVLQKCLDSRGFLSGRLDSSWSACVPWACLTGTSQMAWNWGTLGVAAGDDKLIAAMQRANAFVRRTVQLSGGAGEKGGIAGSWPIDGDYGHWQYLNWAAKFTIDAQLLELRMASYTGSR